MYALVACIYAQDVPANSYRITVQLLQKVTAT